MNYFVFSFFIEQENWINRIRVHLCDPFIRVPKSFASLYTLRKGGLPLKGFLIKIKARLGRF